MPIVKSTTPPPAKTGDEAMDVYLKGSLPKPEVVTSPADAKDKRIWVSGILQSVIMSQALVPFITRIEDFAPIIERETKKLLDAHKRLVKGE